MGDINCKNNKIKSIPKYAALHDNRCFSGMCIKCKTYTYFCEHANKYICCECCKNKEKEEDEINYNINYKIKSCEECMFVKVESCKYSQTSHDYYCTKSDRKIMGYVEMEKVNIPKWCVFRKK